MVLDKNMAVVVKVVATDIPVWGKKMLVIKKTTILKVVVVMEITAWDN